MFGKSTPMSLLAHFSLSFLSLTLLSTYSSAQPSAYDVLKSYDLPPGILPQGVTGYELDANTGKFAVHLNGGCHLKIADYELVYEPTITGTISKDKLAGLNGVSVKIVVIDVNIGQVARNGDQLEFSAVGQTVKLPVNIFDTSPQCSA